MKSKIQTKKKSSLSSTRKKLDDERKIRSRGALLEAAAIRFIQSGYHNTLISDIVSEAGFGQGTFYRHFSSKREIFEVYFDEFIGGLLNKFVNMSENLPTTQDEYYEASLSAINQMTLTIRENHDVVRMFLREATAVDQKFEEKASGFMDRFAMLAKSYLDHAIEKGFARPCNSQIVADSLIGIGVHMVTLMWRKDLQAVPDEKYIKELVDFGFFGIGRI
jgi:TetR/AcrR family transcriptional regulator, fatty acid metabolism regulator protein